MSDGEHEVYIGCSVITKLPEHALKASEVLARTAAGLMLEGISVSVNMHTIDPEADDAG